MGDVSLSSFKKDGSSMSGGGSPAPQGAPKPTFFSEFKKGEVNELLQWLQEASLERDMEKQREVIKRVIAYMTIGIDVSRLFPDMIMVKINTHPLVVITHLVSLKACNTRDPILKKLVYLYLSTYARSHPDLSLLAVNTLIKDVTDVDPMIRGLALRYLCSVRYDLQRWKDD